MRFRDGMEWSMGAEGGFFFCFFFSLEESSCQGREIGLENSGRLVICSFRHFSYYSSICALKKKKKKKKKETVPAWGISGKLDRENILSILFRLSFFFFFLLFFILTNIPAAMAPNQFPMISNATETVCAAASGTIPLSVGIKEILLVNLVVVTIFCMVSLL